MPSSKLFDIFIIFLHYSIDWKFHTTPREILSIRIVFYGYDSTVCFFVLLKINFVI